MIPSSFHSFLSVGMRITSTAAAIMNYEMINDDKKMQSKNTETTVLTADS